LKNRSVILLSGCGNLDGSDPFETALSHLALEKGGFEVVYAAPSGNMLHSVNHLNGEVGRQKKAILEESARLSRGKIFELKELSPKLCDAVIIPGGQGVLKNFFDRFGKMDAKPKSEVSDFLRGHHENKGVIVTLSLSVSLMSAVFPEYEFDFDLLQVKSGCVLVNEKLRFISAPASILTSNLLILQKEIENVVGELRSLL
jgi:enhancing lycopene biosynthesis protein 2